MIRTLEALSVVVVLLLSGCSPTSPLGGGASHSAPQRATSRDPAKASGGPEAAGAPAASASGRYSVTFAVTSRSGRLGAVQFDARASGDWQGTGGSVACRNVAGAAMMACNDKGGGLLTCALIDQGGIPTPKRLVVCSLSSSKPVSAGAISVRVVDASTPGMKPASPTVSVAEVRAN